MLKLGKLGRIMHQLTATSINCEILRVQEITILTKLASYALIGVYSARSCWLKHPPSFRRGLPRLVHHTPAKHDLNKCTRATIRAGCLQLLSKRKLEAECKALGSKGLRDIGFQAGLALDMKSSAPWPLTRAELRTADTCARPWIRIFFPRRFLEQVAVQKRKMTVTDL